MLTFFTELTFVSRNEADLRMSPSLISHHKSNTDRLNGAKYASDCLERNGTHWMVHLVSMENGDHWSKPIDIILGHIKMLDSVGRMTNILFLTNGVHVLTYMDGAQKPSK